MRQDVTKPGLLYKGFLCRFVLSLRDDKDIGRDVHRHLTAKPSLLPEGSFGAISYGDGSRRNKEVSISLVAQDLHSHPGFVVRFSFLPKPSQPKGPREP